MDDFLNLRVYLENQSNSNKVYRGRRFIALFNIESEVMCKVTSNNADLRSRLKPYEDLHDYKSIEQYKSHREEKINRSTHKINYRFPSLNGQSPLEYSTTPKLEELTLRVGIQDQDKSFKKYTLSQTLKLRKLVLPDNHLQNSMSKAFIPVNPVEAKSTIMRTVQHDSDADPLGMSSKLRLATLDHSLQPSTSSALQTHAFKRSSPSPELIKKQFKGLNDANHFTTFLPTEVEQPRLTVLHNFREISRIMTNNFLKHKELEKKYKNTMLPREELEKKIFEEDCTQKMTYIMKQMNSPKSFMSPVKRGFSVRSHLEGSPELSIQPSKVHLGRGQSTTKATGTQLPYIKQRLHNPEDDRYQINKTML